MHKAGPALRHRLSWWWLRAKNETDIWIKFFLYWMMFDAYITEGSGSSSDQKKIRWFIDNDNEIKELIPGYWGNLPDNYSIQILKASSPLIDTRPDRIGKRHFLNDPSNLEEVVNFIYHIRCNLFHGSKDLQQGRDEALVMAAGNLIKKLVDFWSIKP